MVRHPARRPDVVRRGRPDRNHEPPAQDRAVTGQPNCRPACMVRRLSLAGFALSLCGKLNAPCSGRSTPSAPKWKLTYDRPQTRFEFRHAWGLTAAGRMVAERRSVTAFPLPSKRGGKNGSSRQPFSPLRARPDEASPSADGRSDGGAKAVASQTRRSGGGDQRRATIISPPCKLPGDRTTGGLTPGATIDTRIEGFHR
jgi:hypothetical protein